MQTTQWSLSGPENGHVTLKFWGVLDEVDVALVERSVFSALGGLPQGDAVGLIDFNELSTVSVQARASLVELQVALGKQLRRTAYVSDRPVFRGVALWIMQRAPDAQARVFHCRDKAEAWLWEIEDVNRHEQQVKNTRLAWERYQASKSRSRDVRED